MLQDAGFINLAVAARSSLKHANDSRFEVTSPVIELCRVAKRGGGAFRGTIEGNEGGMPPVPPPCMMMAWTTARRYERPW